MVSVINYVSTVCVDSISLSKDVHVCKKLFCVFRKITIPCKDVVIPVLYCTCIEALKIV